MKYFLILLVLVSSKCFSQVDSTNSIDTTSTNFILFDSISTVIWEDSGIATNTAGLSVNYNDTTNFYSGISSINVGNWTTSKFVYIINPDLLYADDYSSLKLFIQLKSILGSSTGNVRVTFMAGSDEVSSPVTLGTKHGFNKTDIYSFQEITIPIDSVTFTQRAFNKIKISLAGIGAGLYLDYINLTPKQDTTVVVDTLPTQPTEIRLLNTVFKFDTIKVAMLVSDTSDVVFDDGTMFYPDSSDTPELRASWLQRFVEPKLFWMYGYEVRAIVVFGTDNNTSIPTSVIAGRLDLNMRPLRKWVIVWETKKIQ